MAAGYASCGTRSDAPEGADSGAVGADGGDAPDARLDHRSDDYSPDGAGDGNSTPDGALSSAPAWLRDPSVWNEVSVASLRQDCRVYEADGTRLQFPPLLWKQDGNGFDVADIVQGFGSVARGTLLDVIAVNGIGVPWLHEALRVDSAEGDSAVPTIAYGLRRLIRLDSGATVAAVEARIALPVKLSFCDLVPFRRGHLEASSELDGGDVVTYGRAPLTPDGAWTWAVPTRASSELPAGNMALYLDTTSGEELDVGRGGLTLMPKAASTDWTVLESPSSSDVGSSEGDLAVWNDYAIPGNVRVRGWAPDGKGVRTLVDGLTDETVAVTASPTHLVGVARVGPVVEPGGVVENGYFWRSPRSYDVSTTVLTKSPRINVPPFSTYLVQSWGDYAVFGIVPLDMLDGAAPSGTRAGPPFVLVVQLSIWKMWEIDEPHDGYEIDNVAAVGPDYVYFNERPVPPGDPKIARGQLGAVTRLVRVRLQDVPKIGKEL